MNTTLNIPVNIRHDDVTGFTYCEDSRFESSVYATSPNSAKSKLRPMIKQEIDDALMEHQNYQRKVLACKDGTVLVVYFRYGNWGYDIAGPDRSGCCTNSGFQTFDEAVTKAIDHADQSYGGLLWKC